MTTIADPMWFIIYSLPLPIGNLHSTFPLRVINQIFRIQLYLPNKFSGLVSIAPSLILIKKFTSIFAKFRQPHSKPCDVKLQYSYVDWLFFFHWSIFWTYKFHFILWKKSIKNTSPEPESGMDLLVLILFVNIDKFHIKNLWIMKLKRTNHLTVTRTFREWRGEVVLVP